MTLADRLHAAFDAGRHKNHPLLEEDDGDYARLAGQPAVAAAVLVAMVDRPEPTVILILRPETMRKHAGQIAFPGGRVDPDDDDVIGAALREAEEEIGLPRDRVNVIATAGVYRTITGFEVTPVVAVVPPDLPLIPQPSEVAEIFEVPLAHLLDPANHIERTLEWQGQERHFLEIIWGERRIWGATAAMIVNLARRLHYPA